ncbi:MAG TPA: cobalamin-binding protein [Candidatus Acidoferrum sp.]|jgi:iron complex transport system substrate-binding protein
MRIVSLLPSATEILFALGLGDQVVGISHECDYPPAVHGKTVVVNSRVPKDISPLEIDRVVREFTERGQSIYAVDADALRRLAPDLIVTQNLCSVCAASPEDLAAVLANFDRRPEVLSLDPLDLGDVWRDILWVGDETLRGHEAERLLESIGAKLAAIENEIAQTVARPRVAFLEWLQPIYVGGHWVPEMVEVAGARDVFGKVRTPSYRISLEDVVAAQPQVLVVAPCGYNADQARAEYRSITFPRDWNEMPAVRNNQIYYVDANAYFSRPGPRLVTGIEILAKLFHPGITVSPEAAHAIHPVVVAAHSATA